MKTFNIWRLIAITGLLSLTVVLPAPGQTEEVIQLSQPFDCRPWPEGQKMFYTDSYWRGGDCASTVDLGDGRILWLFADSYIGIKPPYHRKPGCVTMIRNCLGIQSGYDPSDAEFEVYWGGGNETPEAYFPSEDSSSFWPCNGVRVGDFLIVFLMRICPSDSGLGFVHCGHAAYLLSNIDRNPDDWLVSPLTLPDCPTGIWLGAATLVEPPYLYLFNLNFLEADNDAIFLARWHIDSLLSGQPDAFERWQIKPRQPDGFEWWMGIDKTWVHHSELKTPSILFTGGASEFSVVYDELTDQYLSIQAVGFGAADIMIRTSPGLTGPWTDSQLLYQPLEKSIAEVMIYAAKAHPEIIGADLVLSYNTNAPFRIIFEDTTIYYPVLLKCNWNFEPVR